MLKSLRVFTLLVALAAGSIAQGATIAFVGSGTSGTINPNSQPWLLTPDDHTTNNGLRGASVWGSPGLSVGTDTWPANIGQAVEFSITFTGLPGGVTIDQSADPTPLSFNDFTRFHNTGDSIIWTATYSGGNTVTFDAPSGYKMPAGTDFFVNIAFTGGSVSGVQFTGDFVTAATVPEPGSLPLVAVGLLGAALIARRRISKEW